MEILEKYNPSLFNELNNKNINNPDEETKIEISSSGEPTLLIKGIYIHSRRDPKREGERIAEAALINGSDENTPVIILGLGLAYSAISLAEKFPERPIIIAEKYHGLLLKAMEFKDLEKLFTHPKIIFVLGGTGEALGSALSVLEHTPGSEPLVIQNKALYSLDEDWYKNAENQIKIRETRANVNRATQKRFGKRWVKNLSKNLESVKTIPGIKHLRDLFKAKNIPVFLAAAGPTLDMSSAMLGEIQKRCITVAADTSLRFFIQRGMEPDFVVSVDPQYWNFRHLDRVPSPGSSLITESAVYPPSLRHEFGRIFLCSSFFPLGKYMENEVDPKGELGAGGSVATSAWDFSRLLGVKTIWIAGLDLSFPELKTHFKGALFEEKSLSESRRCSPAETWNMKALRDGQPFLSASMGGGEVLTDKRLSLYASWFENRFSLHPETENYTTSDKGLAIKGLKTESPDKLLELPQCREEINKILEKAYSEIDGEFNSLENKKTRSEKFIGTKKTLLLELENIKRTSFNAGEEAGIALSRCRLNKLGDREKDQIIIMLDNANNIIKNSAVKEIAGFLFPDSADWETEGKGGGDSESSSFIRFLEFSARFYRELYMAVDYTLKELI